MNIETLRTYLIEKSGVTEGFPFGEDVLVFKVMGKMFALLPIEEIPIRINLKCDPEQAILLREQFDAVAPGFHQNKKHWNTLTLDGTLSPEFVEKWIDHSYDLIVAKLTKKLKAELLALSKEN